MGCLFPDSGYMEYNHILRHAIYVCIILPRKCVKPVRLEAGEVSQFKKIG